MGCCDRMVMVMVPSSDFKVMVWVMVIMRVIHWCLHHMVLLLVQMVHLVMMGMVVVMVAHDQVQWKLIDGVMVLEPCCSHEEIHLRVVVQVMIVLIKVGLVVMVVVRPTAHHELLLLLVLLSGC